MRVAANRVARFASKGTGEKLQGGVLEYHAAARDGVELCVRCLEAIIVSKSMIRIRDLDMFGEVYSFGLIAFVPEIRPVSVYLNFTLWNVGVNQVLMIMFFGGLLLILAPSAIKIKCIRRN